MHILLISYDLNSHERPQAYEAVEEAIEQGAHDWERPLYSQWLVWTSMSQNEWLELLRSVTDLNDSLFYRPC